MASGDRQALLLAHTEERGNLGDGFDAMNVRFQQNPDNIPGERLEEVSTALQISPELRIRGPFIGAGMSVGSIGSETWRARVLATRALGSQLDTGEGGYPTIFILDSDWNPLEVNEKHAAMLGQL